MNILNGIHIVLAILGGVITTIIPCIIAIVKAVKAHKAAKNEAELEKAKNDMLLAVNSFIENAEVLYKNIESIVKANGSSCGAIKKENVMTKLQAYAIEKGYTFDTAYWSEKIDEIVTLTRKVNAK